MTPAKKKKAEVEEVVAPPPSLYLEHRRKLREGDESEGTNPNDATDDDAQP